MGNSQTITKKFILLKEDIEIKKQEIEKLKVKYEKNKFKNKYHKNPFGCLNINEKCTIKIDIPKSCKTKSVKLQDTKSTYKIQYANKLPNGKLGKESHLQWDQRQLKTQT